MKFIDIPIKFPGINSMNTFIRIFYCFHAHCADEYFHESIIINVKNNNSKVCWQSEKVSAQSKFVTKVIVFRQIFSLEAFLQFRQINLNVKIRYQFDNIK